VHRLKETIKVHSKTALEDRDATTPRQSTMTVLRRRQPFTMTLSKLEIERRLLFSSRDICINWQGAALRTCDYVLIQRQGDITSLVGQLIDLKELSAIPKGESNLTVRKGKHSLKRMALARFFPFVDESVPSLPWAGENCHIPYTIKEVMQLTMLEWLPVESVVNICFIFHCDTIQK
jgi:hypothetical protein